jgi:DNA modification methylase
MSIRIIQTKDNIDELRKLDDCSIDHFIFDPLYNSNRVYTSSPDDEGTIQIMADIWKGGKSTYMLNMEQRFAEMYRALKKTGNIICHCDDTMRFYIEQSLRSLNMHYRGTIIWSYSGGGISKKDVPSKHDTILVFCKSNHGWVYNPTFRPYSLGTKSVGCTSAMVKIDTESKGTPFTWVWDVRTEAYERYLAEKENWPFLYEPDYGSIAPVPAGWQQMEQKANTEKPLGLYKKIIHTFTNPGDIIVDPYMGGGTTVLAAAEMDRHAIGMDFDINAFNRTVFRLEKANIPFSKNEEVEKSFINKNPDLLDAFSWETYYIRMDGGTPNKKQRADGGTDGTCLNRRLVYQAKKYSSRIGGPDIRSMHHVALQKMQQYGWENCTIRFISSMGYTSGGDNTAQAVAADIERLSKGKITVELKTATDIELECNIYQPVHMNLLRNNGDVEAKLTSYHVKPVAYTWVLESEPINKGAEDLFAHLLDDDILTFKTTKPSFCIKEYLKKGKVCKSLKCRAFGTGGLIAERPILL